MFSRSAKLAILAGLVAGLSTSAVHAGLLNANAAAMTGFTGSQPFSAVGVSGTLTCSVDYAVFAPGQFTIPASGITGGDPSGGSDYVYAYQIYVSPNSTAGLSSFSVGLFPGLSGARNDGTNATVAGIAPALQTDLDANPNAGSFANSFITNLVGANQNSVIVLFTSPNAPTWASSSVANSGASDQELLPSPIPEPSLGAAAGLVVAGLAGARRRRA